MGIDMNHSAPQDLHTSLAPLAPPAPQAPQLVASDFDGTFANAHGAVPPRLEQAVHAARDAGIDVLIVTARPPRWLRHLSHISGSTIFALNGAFEYSPRSGSLLVHHAFTPAQVQRLHAALAHIPGLAMSAETTRGFWRDPHFDSNPPAGARENDREPGATIAPITTLSDPAGKLLAKTRVVSPEDFLTQVRAAVVGLAELHVSTGSGLAELSPLGVSKATALSRYCTRHLIPLTRVWAVGDMPNDLPMLRAAAVGFAVKNAHPALHEAAHAIAPANTQAGVADVLEAAIRARTVTHLHAR